MSIIKGRDFVIIATQPWDIKIGSNCKNLALEFSRHNRVLYVDPPLDRKTKTLNKNAPEVQRRLEIISEKKPGLVKINENLWNLFPEQLVESINWMPHSFLYHFFNKRNNVILVNRIKAALEKLAFKNVIVFNDSSMFNGFYAKELLNPALAIYYIRDNLITQQYFKKHGQYLEPELARKYDGVVSNSVYLGNYLRKHNPHTYMVGQGCDLRIFDPDGLYPTPPEISTIKRPIIGYMGYLTDLRLDIDLLVYLARANPDFSLVLVGPEDAAFQQSELHQLENVHFLGGKGEHELPGYIYHFDVAINPQVVNGMTIGNYPRKIDEYLAMGKPTVATATETMEYFQEVVLISNSKENFSENIRISLNDDSEEKRTKRIQFANEHTWEKNSENIYAVIERLI